MNAFGHHLWEMTLEAAPWLLLGLLAAGVIRALVPERLVARFLGRKGLGSIVWAAILGAPLPLCSCSVLPVAIGLRRQGASRGATASFLVSAPETGADSIALSYVLLGPFLAITRPVAAVVSAIASGLLVEGLTSDGDGPPTPEGENGSCCHTEAQTSGEACGHDRDAHPSGGSVGARLAEGIRFSLTQLLDDLSLWLAIGLVVAALVRTFVADDALTEWGSGPLAMAAMLLVGLPLYICATASTPLAAAMLVAGVSPGAVLVFLLAGPATNVATLAIVRRELGTRALALYLAAIGASAFACGLTTDAIVRAMSIDISAQMSHGAHLIPHWAAVASAVVLIVLAVRPVRRLLPGIGGSPAVAMHH